jgi:hypothetical protein
MKKDHFPEVEEELYNLSIYRRIIEQLKYELQCSKPNTEGSEKSSCENNKASIKKINEEIQTYEDRIKSLESALASLNKFEFELIEAKYLKNGEYNNTEAMIFLGISKNRYYELKWTALAKLKRVLGHRYFKRLKEGNRNN